MNTKRKKWLSAIGSPLTLAVSAAGAATFVVSGLWWVLPLTLGVAGVVSATHYRGQDDDVALPAAYATRRAALFAAIDRVLQALRGSSKTIRTSLSDVPQQLEQMRGTISRLIVRQARIDGFVREAPAATTQQELRRLRAAEGAARSDDARQKFAAAAENKQAEIDSRADLVAASERIAAELAEIDSALASTLSKIIALEDQHGEAARLGSEGIAGGLGEVLTTVNALETALGETFDPQGTRARR